MKLFKIVAIVILFLVAFGIAGCQNKHDVLTSFTPPEWIQGKWTADNITFEFTPNSILHNGAELKTENWQQKISDSGYSLTWQVNYIRLIFAFIKIDANSMYLYQEDNSNSFTKTLIKQ